MAKQRAGESDEAFGARCYRERLRREVAMHTGVGRHCQRASRWLRRERARELYRQAKGYGPDPTWSTEALVEHLVRLAYPEVAPSEGKGGAA